jgi:hypothetical protein
MKVNIQPAAKCQRGWRLSGEWTHSRVVEHVGLEQDLVYLSSVFDLKPFAGGQMQEPVHQTSVCGDEIRLNWIIHIDVQCHC